MGRSREDSRQIVVLSHDGSRRVTVNARRIAAPGGASTLTLLAFDLHDRASDGDG